MSESKTANFSKGQRRAFFQTRRFCNGITEIIALVNLGKKPKKTFFNKNCTFEKNGEIFQSPKEPLIQKIAKQLN